MFLDHNIVDYNFTYSPSYLVLPKYINVKVYLVLMVRKAARARELSNRISLFLEVLEEKWLHDISVCRGIFKLES